MKRIFTILWMLGAVLLAMAQGYTLTGSVEPVVHVGENFKLRYTLNTTEGSGFRLGTLPDALEVLIGPSQSTSISTVMVNGRTTTSRTLTLTYVLSASETGKFTIPAATVTVEGRTVKSEPLTVQVIASGSSQGGSQGSQQGSHRVTASDFFVLVTASKKHVTENEPLLLTFKVCWHPDVPVINLDDISLELQNVYMQAYNDTQQKSKQVGDVGGRTMVYVDWKQYVVYPQKAGVLQIPSLKMKGYVREDLPYDPFDPFTANYREVPVLLTTPSLDIQVDELPARPADFSGGVGRFTLDGALDKAEVAENTPVTLTLRVAGRGNLNMLKEPTVSFPRTFDTYDTKQNEQTTLTAEGLDGGVTFDIVAVPQRRGDYTLPPATFTYFDLDSRAYKTLRTDSLHLRVTPGQPGSATTMHDYSDTEGERRGDIRDIRRGPADTAAAGSGTFFLSVPYLVALAAIVAAFIVALLVLRRRAEGRADVVGARGKRASRVAVSRLRKAARLMKAGDTGQFYDETLRALWGYVGDKLNMPVSQLTRENISQRLEVRGVDADTTQLFVDAIDDCEFVRYAPGDPQGNMGKVYEKSKTAIEHIDQKIRKEKKKGGSEA